MNLYDINVESEARALAFVDWLLYDPMEPIYLDYLDGLHDAGVKMTKAGIFLREDFGLDKNYARALVLNWITTYDYDFENER